MISSKTWTRAFLVLTLVLGISSSFGLVHPVRAAGTISIDPPTLSPVANGTEVIVNVRVDGMDQFIAWDIAISTDTHALNATLADPNTQTIFPQGTATTLENCVNNAGLCSTSGTFDGMGIVHVAGVDLSSTPSASSGILFSVHFRAGTANYTSIHFLNHQIVYSNPILNDAVDGMYGTPPVPDFSLALLDQSLSVIQGASVNTNITVSSVNAFSGQVNFTATTQTAGISFGFIPNNVTLNNSTRTAKIVVYVALSVAPTGYSVNVTGTSNGLVHYALLTLDVQRLGDFTLGFSQEPLPMPPSSSASTTVLLTSAIRAKVSQEFSGRVVLSVTAPRNTWTNAPVNATLAQTSLYLTPGGANSTLLSVSVPASPLSYSGPFTYQINVTAVSASNPNVNQTQTLYVVPPPFDLDPIVTPDTLTIHAGQSGIATLTVLGFNYFTGYIYPSSTLAGGTAKYDASYHYTQNGASVAFALNVTIDPATASGNYLALLTVQGQTQLGATFARSIGVPITVVSSSHSVQLPTKILGLTVTMYFGVLGGFAAIFVLLAALFYRKARSDKDVWD